MTGCCDIEKFCKLFKWPQFTIEGQWWDSNNDDNSIGNIINIRFKKDKILSITCNTGKFIKWSPFNHNVKEIMTINVIPSKKGNGSLCKLHYNDVVIDEETDSIYSAIICDNQNHLIEQTFDGAIRRQIKIMKGCKMAMHTESIIFTGGTCPSSYKYIPIQSTLLSFRSPPEWNASLINHSVLVTEHNEIIVLGGEFQNTNEFNHAIYMNKGNCWEKITANRLYEGKIVAGFLFDNILLILMAYNKTTNYNGFLAFNLKRKKLVTLSVKFPFMKNADLIGLDDWDHSYCIVSGYCLMINRKLPIPTIPIAMIKLICMFFNPHYLVILRKSGIPMDCYCTDLTNIVELNKQNDIFIHDKH